MKEMKLPRQRQRLEAFACDADLEGLPSTAKAEEWLEQARDHAMNWLSKDKSLWIIMTALFLFGMTYASTLPIFTDERVYIVSAAYMDVGVNVNPEHPLLVKKLFSLALPTELKTAIREQYGSDIIPELQKQSEEWKNQNQASVTFGAVVWIRYVTAITLFALIAWSFRNDARKAFTAFMIIFLTGLFYAAVLDGWLTVFSMIAANAFNNKREDIGTLFGMILCPLTKVYGFIISAFIILMHPKNAAFKTIVTITTVALFFGGQNLLFGLHFFQPQATRGVLNTAYLLPIMGPLLVNMVKKT